MSAPPHAWTGGGADDAGAVRVGVADWAVAADDATLYTLALGSCVAIVLWDQRAAVGGLAHVLLPGPELSRGGGGPARFPATAVPRLLAEMAALGAGGPVTARLVGGASMFRSLLLTGGVNVGERNVVAARAALAAAGIPIVAEDVGGEHGRSVFFHVRSGAVRVRSLVVGDRDL